MGREADIVDGADADVVLPDLNLALKRQGELEVVGVFVGGLFSWPDGDDVPSRSRRAVLRGEGRPAGGAIGALPVEGMMGGGFGPGVGGRVERPRELRLLPVSRRGLCFRKGERKGGSCPGRSERAEVHRKFPLRSKGLHRGCCRVARDIDRPGQYMASVGGAELSRCAPEAPQVSWKAPGVLKSAARGWWCYLTTVNRAGASV